MFSCFFRIYSLFHCAVSIQFFHLVAWQFSLNIFFSMFRVLFFSFIFIFNFRAPLSVRGNNCNNGGPGSEHSLPPSYNRTRNNLLRIPAIIGGNGNSATNAIQQSHRNNDNNSSNTNTTNSIIDAKLSKSRTDIQGIDELFLNATNNSNGSHDTITNESNAKSAEIDNATNSKSTISVVAKIENDTKSMVATSSSDLVTIVTITGCTTTESSTGGEMNILAHL